MTGLGRSGPTTFEWLEGRFFLTQRFVIEHPAAPSGIAIIGAGADEESFVQHCYDSRGVARSYQMSLEGGMWKLCREAPGAHDGGIASCAVKQGGRAEQESRSADGRAAASVIAMDIGKRRITVCPATSQARRSPGFPFVLRLDKTHTGSI